MVAEREIPAWQCTNTRPPLCFTESVRAGKMGRKRKRSVEYRGVQLCHQGESFSSKYTCSSQTYIFLYSWGNFTFMNLCSLWRITLLSNSLLTTTLIIDAGLFACKIRKNARLTSTWSRRFFFLGESHQWRQWLWGSRLWCQWRGCPPRWAAGTETPPRRNWGILKTRWEQLWCPLQWGSLCGRSGRHYPNTGRAAAPRGHPLWELGNGHSKNKLAYYVWGTAVV